MKVLPPPPSLPEVDPSDFFDRPINAAPPRRNRVFFVVVAMALTVLALLAAPALLTGKPKPHPPTDKPTTQLERELQIATTTAEDMASAVHENPKPRFLARQLALMEVDIESETGCQIEWTPLAHRRPEPASGGLRRIERFKTESGLEDGQWSTSTVLIDYKGVLIYVSVIAGAECPEGGA